MRWRVAQILRDEKRYLIPPPEAEVIAYIPHLVSEVEPYDSTDEEKAEREQKNGFDYQC
jgi:hypothetical protein